MTPGIIYCKNKIKNPPEKMGLKILKRMLINL